MIIAGLLVFFAAKFDFSDISELLGNNTAQGTSDNAGFPKKLFGDRPLQFERCGSSLVMVTDSKIYLYSSGGETVLNLPHSYTRPTFFSSDKKILLYDRGGNNFQVDSSRGASYEREMPNEIICGVINGGGTVAVATTEERYAGSVTIYSSQNKQLFKWYLSDGQITGLSLRDDGQLAVSCIGAKDGAILSTVYLMNISQGQDQNVASVSFTDMMILSARFKNNGSLCVIGDTKTAVVSTSGEIQAEYQYGKNISDYSDRSGDYTAVVLSSSVNSSEHEAVLLDNGGNKTGSYVIQQEIKWTEVSGDSVYILTESEILQFDSHMNLVKQTPVRSDADKIAVIGSTVYILGLGEISIAGS